MQIYFNTGVIFFQNFFIQNDRFSSDPIVFWPPFPWLSKKVILDSCFPYKEDWNEKTMPC